MKLEKDTMKEIRIALTALEAEGAVLWWERLNSGKVETVHGGYIQLCRQGTPDFIASLKSRWGLVVYFIEAKSDTGKQKAPQMLFQQKCAGWALYELVTDVKQVRSTVEKITEFYKNKLAKINIDLP